ncbi:hypothetical protein, partial [Streptomyces sp. SID3915]|uniref:hypothetical protein n=1 Tax=Streptomyces sp. SID3915 TaxID=2690263 RepID=UPI00136C91B2
MVPDPQPGAGQLLVAEPAQPLVDLGHEVRRVPDEERLRARRQPGQRGLVFSAGVRAAVRRRSRSAAAR